MPKQSALRSTMCFGAYGNILLQLGDFAQELGETLVCPRVDPGLGEV